MAKESDFTIESMPPRKSRGIGGDDWSKPSVILDPKNLMESGWNSCEINVNGRKINFVYQFINGTMNKVSVNSEGTMIMLKMTATSDSDLAIVSSFLSPTVDSGNYKLMFYNSDLTNQVPANYTEQIQILKTKSNSFEPTNIVRVKIPKGTENLGIILREGKFQETTPKKKDDYWEKIDEIFFRTMKITEQYYETLRFINLIIVGVGLLFIGIAIYEVISKGSTDPLSLASGSLGVASFVSYFFISPQSHITRALGNLAQLQMVYKAHSVEFEALRDYDWEKFNRGDRSIEEIKKMDEELERGTGTLVKILEKYIQIPEKRTKDKTDEHS